MHGPPFPEAADYLWRAYQRLAGRRGSNGFGVNPWTWEALDAFVRNSGMRLAPWEVEILEMLDDCFLVEQATQAKARAAEGERERGAS